MELQSLILFSILLLSAVAAGEKVFQNLLLRQLIRAAPISLDDDGLFSPDSNSDVNLYQASLHVEFFHRDSLHAAAVSPEEVLAFRLSRDSARAAALTMAATAVNFSSTVISGLAQGSGEYFTQIGVGTPARGALMVLDTGSDIVWLQCSPCRRCYTQSGKIFDPTRSRSFAAVPCDAALCHRLDLPGCDSRRRACLYEVSYGDGSVTAGEFATETLTFRGGARVPRVALGCGHDNEGLFVAAAGLLGLGRGDLSFPSQAGRRFGRKFSYCLVDRTAVTGNRSSAVVFGGAANGSGAATYTPMVRNPKMDTFYYIELEGVSVGGSRVAGASSAELRLDPATGKGGVIVDSGTSVTRLARPVYEAVRDAFRAAAAGLPESAQGFSLFDTCYDLSGRKVVKVPTVSLHLSGGSSVSLPAENYLIPVDSHGTFCFALAGTDSGVSIVGNIQQQGFRIIFDVDRSRIGFLPRAC